MEDNSSSDEEIKDSFDSNLGGKKLKLNDGSSQDSLKESINSLSKDENVDSGVSADKSESTSSDDRATNTSGPSNEVINAAPSSSNVHAILLNIRRPIRSRNYRKRKTPGQDSDSNDSSRDSDDLSLGDSPQPSRHENSNSEADSDELQRIIATFSEGSPAGNRSSDAEDATSVSSDSAESDGMIHLGDSDTDDELWSRSNEDNEETDENKGKTPPVLLKTRPQNNYLMVREIINREMGLTFPCGKMTKNDVLFEQKFYGSLHTVYRLQKLHTLCKHKGCVNSINFHPEGNLLASGSDDTNIVVWDWARNVPVQAVKTGHKSNVFQSKFLYLNARSQLNIVTCARDGQVRLIQCPPSGGLSSKRRLATHARAAHKLHVSAAEPHLVISAGEDGVVMQCDVRAEHASRLFQVKDQMLVIPLYSVHGHPLETQELVVAGRDKYVRVYDRRRATKPLALYCPGNFNNNETSPLKKKARPRRSMHLTCAVYNHDGTEILGSYNEEDVYLFDTKNDIYDKVNSSDSREGFSHRYTGHRNSATFKGVSFFGPKSEYVVSGSDCSYIYIWEKNSESIVQWLHGDDNGVVNCIETHPRFPVLATSGLDKDVKIWIPKAHRDPTYDGLERVVRDNNVPLRSPLFNDFLPTLYSAWRGENRLFTDDEGVPSYGGNVEFEGNMCTTF